MSATNDNRADSAGVMAPPPLIAVLTVALGLLLDWLLPAYLLTIMLSFWERMTVGLLLVAGGGALAVPAMLSFRRAGTHIEPWKPSLRLTTGSVYRYVRNPMYVGLMLAVGGIGVALASDWTLVLLVAMAFVLHHGVVLREERYLEGKFGEEYRRYKATVPRWGIL